METFVIVLAAVMIAAVLVDAFETIVLPRRVASRFRLTRLFYRNTWRPWRAVARAIRSKKKREAFLSVYGPLSIMALLGLWAVVLIVAFALLRWVGGADDVAGGLHRDFGTELYMSGIVFVGLTLETSQLTTVARWLTVSESILGFAFLAVVIGYFPVLYQSFSRREANITLLDARAGSPPNAAELLRRYGRMQAMAQLPELLREWERWAAELLESHISYPVLAYFRSQHDNQSWLGSLTTMLDASALVVVGVDGLASYQAQMTFAMARHAVVDLSKVFSVPPCFPCADRLPGDAIIALRETLAAEGVRLDHSDEAERRLAELRSLYEPYVDGLSRYLLMELPPWHAPSTIHNWETSAWERRSVTSLH